MGVWWHSFKSLSDAFYRAMSMISNDRPSPLGPRRDGAPKPAGNEETLRSGKIFIERKTFMFALKANAQGRFLRITEEVGGRYDAIIIPATGLEEFRRMLDEMVKASNETPQ